MTEMIDAIMAIWPGARINLKASPMIDPTPRECRAIELASDPAGEYLDNLKKTDLATLTESEWFTFLEVVVTGFQDGLCSIRNEYRNQA
jgi:hypothetical protein